MTAWNFVMCLALGQFADRLGERGNHLLPIPNDAITGFLEDIGFRVFVDSDDDLGAGAARHVLAGPGDGNGDIHLRGNGLTRQANLVA